jgi:hypothetical protein
MGAGRSCSRWSLTSRSVDLRARLLKHLVTPQADTRFGESYLVGTIAGQAGCRPHEVWEALWSLVGDGLVYLDSAGQHSGTDNWLWRASSIGIQVAAGGPWEPRDPSGYLRRLRKHMPEIDAVAVRYVEEALRAFNARCYLATSVMLGVAAERVFDLLANSVVDGLGDRARKLREALENPRTAQFARFTELRKVLEPMRSELPDGLADRLTLDAVGDLLRVTRNEAGHPTGTEIDEDTANAHLQIAAGYLQKMTTLRQHFAQQSAGDAGSG